jgi:hypothetical protein
MSSQNLSSITYRLSIIPLNGPLEKLLSKKNAWNFFGIQEPFLLTTAMFYSTKYLDTNVIVRDSLPTLNQLFQYRGLSGYECIFMWRKSSTKPLEYNSGNFGIRILSKRQPNGCINFLYSTSTYPLLELVMNDSMEISQIMFYLKRPYKRKNVLNFE